MDNNPYHISPFTKQNNSPFKKQSISSNSSLWTNTKKNEKASNDLTGVWTVDQEMKFILHEDPISGSIHGFMDCKESICSYVTGKKVDVTKYQLTQTFHNQRTQDLTAELHKECDYKKITLTDMTRTRTWTLWLATKYITPHELVCYFVVYFMS